MVTVQPATFGDLLRRYRTAAGLTQEALAERASLSTRGISDLERGVRRLPRLDTIQLLAEALGLDAAERAAFAAAARRLSEAPPVLVGRQAELALLERHLAGAGPPVLMLGGEPGIGKSRLLQEAAQRASAAGWSVLAGGCQRRGGQEPYAPLLDALERYIRQAPSEQARAHLHGCVWLSRLLPELAALFDEPLPQGTLPPEQERRLITGALARFLANVAGPSGTLLVLDDVQWAGPDALDLLGSLARSAAETPLRVIGAYREMEVQPQDPLAVLLADLAHAGLAAHRTLAPLAPDEAGQLLDGLLADAPEGHAAEREQVLRRAGGVPFFVLSLAQGLRADESSNGDRATGGLPWDVAQGIRQRVAVLPEGARAVLGAAVVVGRVIPYALLVEVAAQPEEQVLDALEAAGQARLLVEESADSYRFAHDLIRELVEADLGPGRRIVLHRRVAEALERRPGTPPVELLAYHYGRAGVPEKAVLYLERAGDHAAAQAAHAAAQSYYEQWVERLDGLGRVEEGARAREKLGALLRSAARYDAAAEVLDRAAEMYRAAHDPDGEGRAVAQIGHVYADRMMPEEGLRRLRPAVEALSTSAGSESVAALYVALGHLCWACHRLDEQLAAAERAAALAPLVQDGKLLAEIGWMHGFALTMADRSDEALAVMEATVPLAEAAGDLYSLAHTLNNMGCIYDGMGKREEAKPYFDRALAAAERGGDLVQIAFLLCNRGAGALDTGDWGAARADFERALALSRAVGLSKASAEPLVGLGSLSLCEGAWDEASRYLEEALTLAERMDDLSMRWRTQNLLAERDLLQRRPEGALARLEPLLDHPDLAEGEVIGLLPTAAWAHLALGALAQAEETSIEALARARAYSDVFVLLAALRVRAMVLIARRCWEEAVPSLEEGLSLARGLPYPYAEARLLHLYASMHIQQGEPEPARERLQAALDIFQRLGARKDVEQVEQALAPLGWPGSTTADAYAAGGCPAIPMPGTPAS